MNTNGISTPTATRSRSLPLWSNGGGRLVRSLCLTGLLATALAACGGGGGSSTDGTELPSAATDCVPSDASTAAQCSTLLVGLTDAEGDIVSYSVDVTALSLQRANGDIVETLPASTRVDFAQLTDLTELVSAALLPPGNYVGGTIRLDYSDAEIYVEAGGDVVAAVPTDLQGDPLGIVDLQIDLPANDRLFLTRGRAAFLSIDFDLAASHSVDTSVSPPMVSTQPFITAELQPVDEKDLRVRGALVDVNVSQQSYSVRLRPWHRRIGDHGAVTIQTSDTTTFEFGDEVFTGDAGLSELAMLNAGALTAAFGTLDIDTRTFTASIVLAREAVEGDMLDAIHGNVVARSGDLLTVRGAFGVHRNDRARFHRTAFVQVGPQTRVVKITDPDGQFDKDDLSVGQRIVAFGQFDPDTLDPDMAPILDATEAGVRMHPTHIFGEVVDVMTGQVTLDLRAIDRLSIELFDFTGTGLTESMDADADAYEVASGNLAIDSLAVGRPARIIGFANRFGEAPPDFSARSLVSHAQLPASLGIGWVAPGTTAAFLSLGGDGLVPDLSNPDIGERHHMLLGRELIDLFDLDTPPTIAPNAARGLYSLHEPGHVELFADFASFAEELALRIGESHTVRSMSAYGRFAEDDATLESRKVVVFTAPAQ